MYNVMEHVSSCDVRPSSIIRYSFNPKHLFSTQAHPFEMLEADEHGRQCIGIRRTYLSYNV